MPTIPCPGCQRSIDDRVGACPSCGFEIAPMEDIEAALEKGPGNGRREISANEGDWDLAANNEAATALDSIPDQLMYALAVTLPDGERMDVVVTSKNHDFVLGLTPLRLVGAWGKGQARAVFLNEIESVGPRYHLPGQWVVTLKARGTGSAIIAPVKTFPAGALDWFEEQVRRRIAEYEQQRPVAHEAPAANSAVAELERLGNLRKEGLLTEEEFSAAKRRVLGL